MSESKKLKILEKDKNIERKKTIYSYNIRIHAFFQIKSLGTMTGFQPYKMKEMLEKRTVQWASRAVVRTGTWSKNGVVLEGFISPCLFPHFMGPDCSFDRPNLVGSVFRPPVLIKLRMPRLGVKRDENTCCYGWGRGRIIYSIIKLYNKLTEILF